VIPADLSAALTRAIRAAVADGALPAGAARLSPSGTWRPAPGGGYATSLPYELARLAGQPPLALAERLAGALAPLPWVSAAAPTGGGYLTVTVTPAALTGLAPRIALAGPGCARSDALSGATVTAPPLPDLFAATGWESAWRDQAAALAGRLAAACGAALLLLVLDDPVRHRLLLDDPVRHRLDDPVRHRVPDPPDPASRAGADPEAGTGPVAEAVDWAGADAVRYGLARMLTRPPAGLTGATFAVPRLDDPYYLVIFAHSDAASTLRWAADLGLSPAPVPPAPGPLAPREAAPGPPVSRLPVSRLPGASAGAGQATAEVGEWRAEAAEIAVLERLSWFGERVAGAARRQRPAELPRYLEDLAAAWLDCREQCPALPFGGRAAPAGPVEFTARLELAAAVHAVLAAGLDLAGVSARERAHEPGTRK
jgi:arginyl-tRNA synthetase